MYDEHLELLPWIVQTLPPELDSLCNINAEVRKVYCTFYEYLATFINYHKPENPS